MGDFTASTVVPPKVVISSHGATSQLGMFNSLVGGTASPPSAWPTANLAIFIPVTIETPVLVQNMAIVVGTQSGNVDVGIYDEKGVKIITAGTTAVAVAGLQVFNITDTVLNPGTYFLAMACDNITAQFNGSNLAAANSQVCGVQQMATAFVLPATVTFANPTNNFQPALSVLCAATV